MPRKAITCRTVRQTARPGAAPYRLLPGRTATSEQTWSKHGGRPIRGGTVRNSCWRGCRAGDCGIGDTAVTKSQIRIQFLAEAILLTLAGVVVGSSSAPPPPPSTPTPKAGHPHPRSMSRRPRRHHPHRRPRRTLARRPRSPPVTHASTLGPLTLVSEARRVQLGHGHGDLARAGKRLAAVRYQHVIDEYVASPAVEAGEPGAAVFTWRGDCRATGWLAEYSQISGEPVSGQP